MASVTIRREWPDGDSLAICIEVDASYPDAVAEAKQQAINAYAGAMEVTMADEDTSDDPR